MGACFVSPASRHEVCLFRESAPTGVHGVEREYRLRGRMRLFRELVSTAPTALRLESISNLLRPDTVAAERSHARARRRGKNPPSPTGPTAPHSRVASSRNSRNSPDAVAVRRFETPADCPTRLPSSPRPDRPSFRLFVSNRPEVLS